MDTPYRELEAAIGIKTVSEDLVTAGQVQRLSALLDRRDPPPREGDPVPWGWHSIFFPRLMPSGLLNRDGMADEFEGGPGMPLPRRMYAGNDLRFHEPLRIGDRVSKEIFIKSVTPKDGRSGRLVFVTYGIRILGPRGLVLEDDQNIVFRDEAPAGAAPPPAAASPAPEGPWKRVVTPNPVMLFRFSAVTFNAHRIHYDRPYVTEVENYPDLIVHGPLTAILLLELLREHWPEPAARMSGFSMRAKAPLFADRPITLVGDPAADGRSCTLTALDDGGRPAMEIAARFG